MLKLVARWPSGRRKWIHSPTPRTSAPDEKGLYPKGAGCAGSRVPAKKTMNASPP